MLDQFTGFVVGENYVKTNYTGSDYTGGGVTVIVRDEAQREGSYVDVVVSSNYYQNRYYMTVESLSPIL